MSSKYKHGDRVPSDVLCARLKELAHAATKDSEAILREFNMRIPAELDRDADCVLSESANRIKELEAALERVGKAVSGFGQDPSYWEREAMTRGLQTMFDQGKFLFPTDQEKES